MSDGDKLRVNQQMGSLVERRKQEHAAEAKDATAEQPQKEEGATEGCEDAHDHDDTQESRTVELAISQPPSRTVELRFSQVPGSPTSRAPRDRARRH